MTFTIKRSFVADIPGIFGGWVRSLDKRFPGWREDVHIHSSFVHRSSFIVFPFCSRIKAVSTPIYPPSSSHWHWGRKGDVLAG